MSDPKDNCKCGPSCDCQGDCECGPDCACHHPPSTLKKLGIAGAIVALPVAAYALYNRIEQTSAARNARLAEKFAYDASAIRQVDPALIKYKEIRQIDLGMNVPQAIALDGQGNLLAAGENLLRRFDSAGRITANISVEGTPYCLAADKDGNIFVGFRDHVEIYSAAGRKMAGWSSFGDRSYLTCIAINGDDIYVADAGRRMVLRCDRAGKVLNEIGKPNEAMGVPGLILPSPHLDVAVGADGLVWVANTGKHRLEAYTPQGRLDKFWGSPGTNISEFFGCCNPTDFALLSDGTFITAEKGIPRVKKYDTHFNLEAVVAAPSVFGENQTGLDVAAGADGRIFVLARGARSVRVFAPGSAGGPQ